MGRGARQRWTGTAVAYSSRVVARMKGAVSTVVVFILLIPLLVLHHFGNEQQQTKETSFVEGMTYDEHPDGHVWTTTSCVPRAHPRRGATSRGEENPWAAGADPMLRAALPALRRRWMRELQGACARARP
mmetsp:Transcript_5907/g.14551  ORF Transcript_5907/g.14551 Transcript_5907/m.14551 type:complete len:130 (+) Transcript_5907:1382-1771(+)